MLLNLLEFPNCSNFGREFGSPILLLCSYNSESIFISTGAVFDHVCRDQTLGRKSIVHQNGYCLYIVVLGFVMNQTDQPNQSLHVGLYYSQTNATITTSHYLISLS